MSTVYILMRKAGDDGEVAGELVSPEHGFLWEHVSSSPLWLRGDLTRRFRDRREKLEALYPDGYEIEMVAPTDPLPDAIAQYFVTDDEET